jgi:hypothetical protein
MARLRRTTHYLWMRRIPRILFVDKSATEQTSNNSAIFNFPVNGWAWGKHHGDVRKGMPWIGDNRIRRFGCHQPDVFCRGLKTPHRWTALIRRLRLRPSHFQKKFSSIATAPLCD